MVIAYPVSEPLDLKKARFIQILQTAHALALQGCEMDLLAGRSGAAPLGLLKAAGLPVPSSLRIYALPVARRREVGLPFSWNAVFHVSCLLALFALKRRRPYDALYVRHPKLAAFLLRFRPLLKIPILYEAHELFYLTTERKGRMWKLKALEGRIFGGVDGIVATTANLKRFILEEFHPSAPIFVVPNGVAVERFDPPAWKEGRTICYIGQLHPWKGVEILIQAMPHLPGEELLIVGGQPEAVRRLEASARAEGCASRVRFAGQVDLARVQDLLAQMNVAVLPGTKTWISAFFTSPLKLFEYMAAGVPIVAADLPSTREVLKDGETALLVEPEDPKALAAGIRRVLGDRELAMKLRAKALEEVQRYSWQERARRLIEAIGEVRGSSRGPGPGGLGR